MKKIRLLLFFVLFSATSIAQEFAPVGATWYYTQTFAINGDTSFVKIESIGDTIIGGNNCKILLSNVTTCAGEEVRNYIWNNGNQVYFFENNGFELLYDFDADAGYEWEIIKDFFGENDTISIHVDSINFENYDGVQLKELYVTISSNIWGYIPATSNKIIERIGDMHFLFPWLNAICDDNFAGPIRCYEDSVISLSFSDVFQTCDYTTDVISLPFSQKSYTVFPNPISNMGILMLIEPLKYNTDFEILNSFGERVYSGILNANQQSQELNLQNIKTGLYYLYLYNNNNLKPLKFIIL